jgi:hypothetical protein
VITKTFDYEFQADSLDFIFGTGLFNSTPGFISSIILSGGS